MESKAEIKPKISKFKKLVAGLAVLASALSFNSNAADNNQSQLDNLPKAQVSLNTSNYEHETKNSEIEALANAILAKGYAIKSVDSGKQTVGGHILNLTLYKNGVPDSRFDPISTKFGEKIALTTLLDLINTEEQELVEIKKVVKQLNVMGYKVIEIPSSSKYVKLQLYTAKNVFVADANSQINNEAKKEALIYFLNSVTNK